MSFILCVNFYYCYYTLFPNPKEIMNIFELYDIQLIDLVSKIVIWKMVVNLE